MSYSLLRHIPGTPEHALACSRQRELDLERNAMQVVADLEAEIARWRTLCEDLIRNGATLPKS